MNNKGFVLDMFVWVIIALVFIIAILGFTFMFDKTTTLLNDMSDYEIVPGKNIGDNYTGNIESLNSSTYMFEYIAVALIFGMIIFIFISNLYAKAHPVFYVVYFIVTVVVVTGSVFISNFWETDILQLEELGAYAQNWGIINHIMLHLPIYVIVVGILGGVFLAINLPKDQGQGDII